jgi:hypothetical protein
MMPPTKRIQILNDNGESVEAVCPVIVSVSRSTDIPAFYADWFFERLNRGFVSWVNPFNRKPMYVSFEDTKLVVFWSKNPAPLLPYLDELKKRGIHCYVQYTINDYERDGLEPGVPKIEQRLSVFKELVTKLGKGAVIWRFDPLILTDQINVGTLLDKATMIGDNLKGYTEKMVFSFADIAVYRKVSSNLAKFDIKYIEFTDVEKNEWAQGLELLNKRWNYSLATCAEDISLEQYGIKHNKCIDDELMMKLFSNDATLMKFIGAERTLFEGLNIKKSHKDKGQRKICGCIVSKDIGEYNTCPHLCTYCYANANEELVLRNWKLHASNPTSERIIPSCV